MPYYLKITKGDLRILIVAALISIVLFVNIYIVYATVDSENPTLTVTITATMTLLVSTDNFGSITAGAQERFATSTVDVATNNISGWNVTLSGDEKVTGVQAMDHDSDTLVEITDQAQWIAPSATTIVDGTAVQISALDNSQDVLAFRVMTASSVNSNAFYATSWWGTVDDYADNANTWFAGIASTTDVSQVGNAGPGSYSASNHLNTVTYYLEVAASQQGGDYSAPLTYTGTSNP